ncbi:hypothetical protein HYT05_00480 [Candidatus Kaiserbacteria bacterium]|nr:hypothetical protein [Candidatus Kaiserbacteria bacterium]
MQKIGALPANPIGAAVYRRKDGLTYLRLNEAYHVKVKPEKENGSWIGDGCAEEIDLEEEVEVIQSN